MFALRVFALIIALAMMTGGFCGAAGSQRMLDLAERRRNGDETVDAGKLQEYVRELVLQRTFGYGVLVVGGMVFLWICFGLVKKGSLTRRPGVVVVVLMGGIVCFMTYRAVVNTRRIKEVGDQHRGEIEARANAKVARIYYGGTGWPRDYSNIVRHLEKVMVSTNLVELRDVVWGHGVLADCYLMGRGCDPDVTKSRRHAEIAARFGDERGESVLKRIEAGDVAPAPSPVKAILDVTGVDVESVQKVKKREFDAPKPVGFFRKGAAYANDEGRVRRISFLGNYGKGCAMTNGVAQVEKLFPEFCRRLDCELMQGGTGERDFHWWIFRFNQTLDWIVQFQLYYPKGNPEERPLLISLKIVGREPDGSYPGTNCRFKQIPTREMVREAMKTL